MKVISLVKVCIISILLALSVNVSSNAAVVYVGGGYYTCTPGHWHHGYWVPRHCWRHYYHRHHARYYYYY